jgi:hypothetical protein
MQRTDHIIHHHDVTPPQRGGTAPVYHYSGEPAVTHTFHLTPDARRRKMIANAKVQATTETVLAQQRTSARRNAFTKFQSKQERQFTPQEVSGYAQWILQADQLLESMRLQAEEGKL